jgi:hypothetical protein
MMGIAQRVGDDEQCYDNGGEADQQLACDDHRSSSNL